LLCAIRSFELDRRDTCANTHFCRGALFPTAESQPETEIEAPPSPPPAELALLERDLQKFLSRNLAVIEKELAPDPAYQLEEYPSDVGRMDFLCKDAHNNWVVIELKADWAGDDAVGQILGYMSWVRDNLPNGSTVRGIIVCKNATGRVKAAIKLVAGLTMKRSRKPKPGCPIRKLSSACERCASA
jgi:RecB family endonuclease NucS